jgi:hypothetical protein
MMLLRYALIITMLYLCAVGWAIIGATDESEARAVCRQAGGVYLNEGICIKREVVLLT